ETLDQYLEYRIEPPATLPEMRDEYLAKITSLEEEESETEAEHLDALVEQWAEFIHPPDKEPSSSHATEPSRVTEPRTTRQPSATEAASTIRAEADEETPHEAIEATIEQAFEAEVVVRASLIPRQDLEALSPRTVTVNDRDTPAIAGIVVQPWDPGMPYLDSLKATPEAEMYQTYLKLRSDFTSSPGFFVDCARFFLKCEQRDTGLRILSSLLDLEIEDPRMIRIVAMLYQEQGDIDAAIELLAQLTRLRPELPQTHRDLALAFAIRGLNSVDVDSGSAESDLERSVELLRQVVLGPWGSVPDHLKHMYGVDGRFEDLSRIALVDLFWVGMAYEKLFGERHGLAVELEAQFPGEIEADLRVVLTWDNDSADVDLWVIEPSGEKVYYGSPTSAAGGILSDDCMDGFGPESYTLRVAPSGTYRIVANYYSEDGPELVGPVTVQATVFTDFGRGTEKSEIRTIRLEDEKDEFEIAVINIE
ncbi:MAG: DUF2135 domain-containing protein, partial [bacterium]|nr:DUF2135 domain-containing protein [bacterium]